MTTPIEVTEPSLSPVIITAKDMQSAAINATRSSSNTGDDTLAEKYLDLLADINDSANSGSVSLPHSSPEMVTFYDTIAAFSTNVTSLLPNQTGNVRFYVEGNQYQKTVIERKTITTTTNDPITDLPVATVETFNLCTISFLQIETLSNTSPLINNSYNQASKDEWINLRNIIVQARETRNEKKEFLIGQGFAVEDTPQYLTVNLNDDPFYVTINWKQPETELNFLIKEAEDSYKASVTYRDNRTAERFAYNFAQLNKTASLGGKSYNWGKVELASKAELEEYFTRHKYTSTFQEVAETRIVNNTVTITVQEQKVICYTASAGDNVSSIKITSTGTHSPYNPSMVDIYVAPANVLYTTSPNLANVIATNLVVPFNSFVTIPILSTLPISSGDRIVIYSSTADVLTTDVSVGVFAGYNLNVVWDPLPK